MIKKSQERIQKSLERGFLYHHLALAHSNEFLRKHDSERLPMFVLYVDLVGSTKMSEDLKPNALEVIIRTFSQEMSYIIEDFDGFVLKFVGDAVLGYFVSRKKTCPKASDIIRCAKTMHEIIDKAMNPILIKNGFPKLKVKVTIDFGDCSIVRYGANKNRSHIDLIGLTLNLAAKMQSVAKPNQTIIGKRVYTKLSSREKLLFKQKKTTNKNWAFHYYENKKPYRIFELKNGQ